MAARTRAAAGAALDGSILVTQTRSGIGTKPKHRGTLRALGLHGVGTSNTLPDRPEIRGMIARVPHLVSVAQAATVADPAKVAKAAKVAKPAKAAESAKAVEPAKAVESATAEATGKSTEEAR